MKRYAAFLRGVMPQNARMAELARAFERAGFTEVKTVLASGNVVFNARAMSATTIEREAEAAMQEHLGRVFTAFVRPVDSLRELIASDPYQPYRLKPGSKRIVCFLREQPKADLDLPVELHGARILRVQDRDAFGAYVASPRGPVFMTLIRQTFGESVTTRTWDTVIKVAR